VPALREAIAEHQRAATGSSTTDDPGDVRRHRGDRGGAARPLRAGDEVVALDPYYDSYARARRWPARGCGASRCSRPSGASTRRSSRAAITPRTRVLLLNSPHNPTGRVLDRAELEQVAAACVEHDLIAISDEVYEHLVFEGEHVPLATPAGDGRAHADRFLDRQDVLGHRLEDRLGVRAGELVAATRGAKQFMTFAGGTPFQHAAAHALAGAEEHGARLASELKAKRDPHLRRPRARGRDRPAPGRHLLRQRRRAPARLRRRRRVLPRAPRARGRRRDPHVGVLRRSRARQVARALRVLQARGGHRRGGGAVGQLRSG
jgi:N-succinyldiaminopimelate aminotransferase